MGKGKTQKKKAKSSSVSSEPIPELDHHVGPSSSTQAMDGHNVEGWTETQIKAYNELLMEREKLEKQRKELEQRSAVSQAGRALLNQNVFDIDSAFKIQTNGTYRFTSSKTCCVDFDSNQKCHHEVCAKSKTEGLTMSEMDTVKYYHMRIFSEKSERIRNALRKQRDLELTRMKREADNLKDKSGKSSRPNGSLGTPSSFDNSTLSKATKETQRLVTSILDQLESLRSELQKGQISSSEMQKQLDIIDAEMHAAHLKTSKFKKSNALRSDSKADSINSGALALPLTNVTTGGKAESYSKAFHIMENFLSASKPGDFQVAVTELKDVLRLSGPMGEDLQSSFDALEGIFDSPDRLSFAGPDGKQECTSIIDLMEKMKETLRRTGKLPDGANSELTRVFQECIDLEGEGNDRLTKEYQKPCHSRSRSDLVHTLSEIRASIISKSPIPPLTEKTLEDQSAAILEQHDVLDLISKVKEGAEPVAVEGYITSMVMNSAKRNPEKYVESIRRLALAYVKVRGEDDYPSLDDAFPRVEAKMDSFVAKLAEKQKPPPPPPVVPDLPSPPLSTGDVSDATGLLNEFPVNTAEIVSDAIRKMAEHDMESNAHLSLQSLISEHGSSGLWPIWLLFAEDTNFAEDHALQEKSQRFENEVDIIMADSYGGLKNAILYLYGAGTCPGLCAAIISEILASISEINQDNTKRHISDLASCISDLPVIVDLHWRTLFGHLALAMVQLYVALHMHVVARFPHLRPVDFSLSTVAMVTTYVCLMSSSHLAIENLKLICVFLNVCMSPDGIEPVREIIEVAKHYEAFCNNDEYRCLTSAPCSHHFGNSITASSKPRPVTIGQATVSANGKIPSRAVTHQVAGTFTSTEARSAVYPRSRFSELIEESETEIGCEPVATSLGHSRKGKHTADENGVQLISIKSAETLAQNTKNSALSGSFSNPLAAYTRLTEAILKEQTSLPTLESAINRAREELKEMMKDPKSHFEWTTRRLKFLLSSDGSSTAPSSQALFDLAMKNFSLFEEYAALLASGLTSDARSMTQIKNLCDDVCDLLSEAKLHLDSPSIQEISKIALRDWARREAGGAEAHMERIQNTIQDKSSNQTDIMSRLQRFCTDLQDLERTRDKIESLTGQPNARKRQVKVFDDLVGELNQTRGVIMDVAGIIAKNRKSAELEDFLTKNSSRPITYGSKAVQRNGASHASNNRKIER